MDPVVPLAPSDPARYRILYVSQYKIQLCLFDILKLAKEPPKFSPQPACHLHPYLSAL